MAKTRIQYIKEAAKKLVDSNGNYKNEYLHLINIFNQNNKNH